MRPFASCINLNQTSSGSPHLLGKGQMGTQTQGKTGFEKTGSILAVPQITAGEAAGTRTGTFVGRSFNKPRLRGAHTALSASGQSCTCLIPPGPANCPHPTSTVSPAPSLLPEQDYTHFPMSVGRLCRDTSFKARWPRLRSWVKPSGSL